MFLRFWGIILVLSSLGVFLTAQTNPAGGTVSAEVQTAANDAFQKQEWKSAAEAYVKIVKAQPQNAGAWYRLGLSQLGLDQNAGAVASFEAALAITPNSVFALAAARSYARTGNKEKLYSILERSLTMGGISPDALKGEPDFASFRTEPKFIDLVKRSDQVVNPCKARPESRQFDFWVGEWLPKNAAGLTVGTSSIQLILGDCVIFENWSTPVSSGKSFTSYSTADGKWHQTWVDDKGLLTYYKGQLENGKMVLDSESVQNGRRTIARMNFSKMPNSDVRQHGENSTDDGKTWTTSFDFIYVRKK